MSSGTDGIWIYVAALAAGNLALTIPALLRSRSVAAANKRFIDSGEETYFEQRRAWGAYGTTPETDPHRLRRTAIRYIALNIVLLGGLAWLVWLK